MNYVPESPRDVARRISGGMWVRGGAGNIFLSSPLSLSVCELRKSPSLLRPPARIRHCQTHSRMPEIPQLGFSHRTSFEGIACASNLPKQEGGFCPKHLLNFFELLLLGGGGTKAPWALLPPPLRKLFTCREKQALIASF